LGRDNPRVVGIILSAGSSRRMGRAKQLMPVKGVPLIERVLDAALNSRLDRVVLVLGHRADEIMGGLQAKARHPGLSITVNEDFEEGIASSIRKGLAEAVDKAEHVMIILGDMPFLNASVIDGLLTGYLASGLPLGAVKTADKRSHPVVFSRGLFPELLALEGDKGARDLFERHKGCAFLFEPKGFFDDRDLDTPEDYLAIEGEDTLF
jgi:molybdenum cofactor cytidylyltransferase